MNIRESKGNKECQINWLLGLWDNKNKIEAVSFESI